MYLGYFCHLELSKIVQSGHTGRDGKEAKIEREKRQFYDFLDDKT